jgi:hypothetical protein
VRPGHRLGTRRGLIGRRNTEHDSDMKRRLVASFFVLLSPLLLFFALVVLMTWALGALVLHLLTLIVWLPVGRRVLFVYSDSPTWKSYIETEVLPRLPSNASVLNWSERSRWPSWSLSVWLFRFYAGRREYNPLAIVVRPWGPPKVFRFWLAFRDFKHGKRQALRSIEAEFFSTIVADRPV